MKYGVVALVDFVSTVHISRQKPFPLARVENLDLVRRGMSAKHSLLVEIVGVCSIPAGMVGSEAEIVKVFFGGDDWG